MRNGIIEISKSEWCNPVSLREKPDGTLRLCENMRELNRIVKEDGYSLPDIEVILRNIGEKKWFTVIDLKDGYFQIRLKESSKKKTAFRLKNRLYQSTRLIMGYENSPAIFQRIMDRELDGIIGNGCEVYLDDIIVYGDTLEEHDKNIERVMERLDKADLRVKKEKIQYRRKEVTALGHIINGEKMKPKEKKKEELRERKVPTTKEEMRRFLGFMNHYSRYIRGYSEKTTKLYEKLKEGVKFEMNEEDKRKIETLKEEFGRAELDVWRKEREIVLETDASKVAAGYILMQKDEKGKEYLIGYGSHKFKKAELNYGITERELLAIVLGVERYEHYLRGRKFKVITDHSALVQLNKKSEAGNERMQRWMEKLGEYNMEIEYRKGEEKIAADALSRKYGEEKAKDMMEKEYGASQRSRYWIGVEWREDGVPEKTGEDRYVREIIKIKERGKWKELAHKETGHGGADKMQEWVENTEGKTWLNMKSKLKDWTDNCDACKRNNQKRSINKGEFIETIRKLQMVGVDTMGPIEENWIICILDYYTRITKLKVTKKHREEEMIKAKEEWCEERGVPEMIMTDTAKEYIGDKWRKYLEEKKIKGHTGAIEVHGTIRRVERVIKTVWEVYRKTKEELKGTLEERVRMIERMINNRVHEGIKMRPEEAWRCKENTKQKEILEKRNSKEGEYAERRFKKEEDKEMWRFGKGEEIWIRRKPERKQEQRFKIKGVITKVEGGSYICTIQKEGGKKTKINYRRIKTRKEKDKEKADGE